MHEEWSNVLFELSKLNAFKCFVYKISVLEFRNKLSNSDNFIKSILFAQVIYNRKY